MHTAVATIAVVVGQAELGHFEYGCGQTILSDFHLPAYLGRLAAHPSRFGEQLPHAAVAAAGTGESAKVSIPSREGLFGAVLAPFPPPRKRESTQRMCYGTAEQKSLDSFLFKMIAFQPVDTRSVC